MRTEKQRGSAVTYLHGAGGISTMRNIFDQYTQWENRVTHALMTALHEDAGLLRRFSRTVLQVRPPRGRPLTVLQQQLPGSLPLAEDDRQRRGLPDGWIHDGAAWCVLIESKVQDELTTDQLRRHRQTAERLGFTDITLVAITARNVSDRVLAGAQGLRWHNVYTWLHQESRRSPWAGRAAAYFDVAEARMVEEEVLTDGQLTTFSGIPFGADHPYTYREAKRILGLAMGDLRARKTLHKELGADGSAPGRPAITGTQASAVWDMIPLRVDGAAFDPRKQPHLTLSIGQHRTLVLIIVPNAIDKACVRRLRDLGAEEFTALLGTVVRNLEPVLAHAPGASPRLRVLQRRYLSRRGSPIDDAALDVDLRTQIADSGSRGRIRHQPEWLTAAFDIWCRKRSNMTFELAVEFPYDRCTTIQAPDALDLFADSWCACRPFLETLRGW